MGHGRVRKLLQQSLRCCLLADPEELLVLWHGTSILHNICLGACSMHLQLAVLGGVQLSADSFSDRKWKYYCICQ